MSIQDSKLIIIANDIQEKYGCHTIILYGSRARGVSTATSDYDIIAVREKGEMERDCRLFEGVYLDIFIYAEEQLENPDASLIRIKDGIVIFQKDKLGDQLLEKIRKLFNEGPRPIPNWEKQVIMTWSEKMLSRAKVEDIEGNFRRHWLLYDLLEAYFHLRDLWYLGPKEAFQWLKENDHFTFTLFDKALQPQSSIDDIERLVDRVSSASREIN